MKKTALILAAWLAMATMARADLVVERWGKYQHTQHKEVTLADGTGGLALTADLSTLPKGTKVARARLVFLAGNGYEPSAEGKALKLVEPYCLWFDATDAARAWAAAGKAKGELTIAKAGRLKPEDVYLEIAYEGKLANPPQQLAGLKAFHQHGQTFLTWTEIEDLAEGKEDANWGEMVKKVRACNPMAGIIPKWPDREIRYSIYRHTEPITAANIGQAEFVHDAAQGSVYIEDSIARGVQGEHGPTFLKAGQVLRRVMLEKNKFLPPGTGFHWVNTAKTGKTYYAVVTSINGFENTAQFTDANTAGPLDETVAPPAPMLVAEKVSDVKRPAGAKYYEQWYSWWCTPPLSAYPRRYDVVIAFCPQTMPKPAPVTISRSAWDYPPELPGRGQPEARTDIAVSHTMDSPIAFRMGPADYHYTLKSPEQSKWRPWPMTRQEALINWLATQFEIDRNRISVGMGSWGMMEIERPDLYAMIHGYGQPGVTEGFQCWGRARGVWGMPEIYAGRPESENPFLRADYSRYVLADPARETPFFNMYPIRSSHLTEMGWPAQPRFLRAMIETRHPFVYEWRAKDRPAIRRDQSVPAFGNCSLDDNPGNGDLRNGMNFDAQINAYLTWDSTTIVDEPGRWEMTAILDSSAPLPECTVDLTPRKCQKFSAKPGDKFKWTCSALAAAKAGEKPAAGQALGTGTVTADKYGLVTIEQMKMAKGAQRVVIVKE